ncbi:MAG: hypothetical protein U5M50_16240 [Sphingobium sp.]|nr:hypothetical protein [Sphingobium sp.]
MGEAVIPPTSVAQAIAKSEAAGLVIRNMCKRTPSSEIIQGEDAVWFQNQTNIYYFISVTYS